MPEKEKFAIMSLSVKPDMQELLKSSSKKMGVSVSELVRLLIEKHLHLVANDGTETPVIFKIPNDLKGHEEDLRNWFSTRVDGVVKKLGQVSNNLPEIL